MGAKYKKDDKCMPDNYVGVFHTRAAKGHRFVPRRRKEMLFIVEVPFLGWMREALLHFGESRSLKRLFLAKAGGA